LGVSVARLGLALAFVLTPVLVGCDGDVATPSPPSPSTARPPSSVQPSSGPSGGPSRSPPASASAVPAATLVGAGDIAACGSPWDEATADLVDTIEGTVFTAGDNAYPSGTADQFRDCYGPSWGRHRDRTRPAAGNHDWETPGAAGYLGYFGELAAPAGETWYAYDLGAWRVIILDSDCGSVGGCETGSEQERWLLDELAGNATSCTLAIWHHARFSSGEHGNDERTDAFWRALHRAGAEVVVVGHDHDYERFAPQDPDGRADPDRGIRQFVVGTGGAFLRPFGDPEANSEIRRSDTHGVIRFTLRPDGYDWAFLSVEGGPPADSGSDGCH
jgi:hypothetical protein